jgi:transcriptional regulator with XRE-family HTH domain
MPNTALVEARRLAGFSQDDLARAIRNDGWQAGDPNGCTREMVHRWESGTVRRPQPRYLLRLENVLGQPAANLGFDADLHYGMNRARVLAEAGLDTALTLPDPAESYGPMSGVWLSSYSYVSSGRSASYTGQHYVVLLQTGARLMVRSVPASASGLSMALAASGRVVTGTWTEQTQPGGYYRGASYHGAIQMIMAEEENAMAGKWVGFGKGGEVNDGPWSLALVTGQLAPEAISEYDVALP